VPANKELPDRRFPRRADFDYSSAATYFVTICTKEKRSLFGRIAESQMLPNRFGRIVQETWHELPDHYPRVNLDCFTLMPNHVHGVLALVDPVGAGLRPARVQIQHSLSEIIRAFKGFSARAIAELDPSLQSAVWHAASTITSFEMPTTSPMSVAISTKTRLGGEFDRENQTR
jgi:putative transposase